MALMLSEAGIEHSRCHAGLVLAGYSDQLLNLRVIRSYSESAPGLTARGRSPFCPTTDNAGKSRMLVAVAAMRLPSVADARRYPMKLRRTA